MSQRQYTVILEQQPDGGFTATVPALPGCVSEGDTRSEALAMIKDAVAGYIECLVEDGQPIPKDIPVESIQIVA